MRQPVSKQYENAILDTLRAQRIVVLVKEYTDVDTRDLVVYELRHDPRRTDTEIARAVAQRILQP